MTTSITYKRSARTVGLFLSVLFIVCYLWYFVRGNSELKQLHESLLSLAFIGWTGMNFISFVLGLIQSFIWGYIGVALWYFARKLTGGATIHQ